jgi:hypothetical protein
LRAAPRLHLVHLATRTRTRAVPVLHRQTRKQVAALRLPGKTRVKAGQGAHHLDRPGLDRVRPLGSVVLPRIPRSEGKEIDGVFDKAGPRDWLRCNAGNRDDPVVITLSWSRPTPVILREMLAG